MIMVRRDFEVSGTDSTDYFLKVMPASLPSTGLEVILWEKFQPLKEKFVAAFLEKPFVWEIYASLEVLYEDSNKKSYFYAYGQIKSSVNFDDCILSGFNIPIESRPHPWTYLFSNTKHFLKEYSEHNIKKYDDDLRKGFKKGYSLQDQLNLEYDSEYPFLYIKRAKFKIQTPFHYNNEIDILFAIGKRKNGQYHLLSPSVFSNKKIDNLFDRLKKNNVNKISSIIRDSRINIMSKSLFEKYGYSLRTSLSFTSFMDDLLILKNRFFNNMDFYFFETLYYQPTFDEAKNHILLKRKEDLNNDKLMYKIMNQRIYYLSNLFKFSNEVRPIVGTNIIIDLLSTIIEVLLMNCFFDEPDNAKKRIAIAAQIILENGDKFIPNWDSLTRNVKPI